MLFCTNSIVESQKSRSIELSFFFTMLDINMFNFLLERIDGQVKSLRQSSGGGVRASGVWSPWPSIQHIQTACRLKTRLKMFVARQYPHFADQVLCRRRPHFIHGSQGTSHFDEGCFSHCYNLIQITVMRVGMLRLRLTRKLYCIRKANANECTTVVVLTLLWRTLAQAFKNELFIV